MAAFLSKENMFVTRDSLLMLPLVNPQVTAGINDYKNTVIDSLGMDYHCIIIVKNK